MLGIHIQLCWICLNTSVSSILQIIKMQMNVDCVHWTWSWRSSQFLIIQNQLAISSLKEHFNNFYLKLKDLIWKFQTSKSIKLPAVGIFKVFTDGFGTFVLLFSSSPGSWIGWVLVKGLWKMVSPSRSVMFNLTCSIELSIRVYISEQHYPWNTIFSLTI